MVSRLVARAGAIVAAFTVVLAGGCSAILGLDELSDRAAEGTTPGDGSPATKNGKVDLLLVIDDSSSMADKSKLLAQSVGSLLQRVAAAGDVHVGVITTSLGGLGSDGCDESATKNARAHLRTTGPGNVTVAGAAQGFLSYGGSGASDLEALIANAEALVLGVGESGCGFEAQLESTYRFLIQPDPWAEITRGATNTAQLVGVDYELLLQRKAFLRPDSVVAIVLLTDEDDSVVDPRSLGGQGWAFMARQFPGSTTSRGDGTTTAPRATSRCATSPSSAECTSCGLAATCNPAEFSCMTLKLDSECTKTGGYYGPTEDSLNVRFHRMKQRFGLDPQFPVSRYVGGFASLTVPNRDGEHPIEGTVIGAYVGTPNCTNPLFAATLPSQPTDDLCRLEAGPRTPDSVVFAVIGGVPQSLVGTDPSWTKILGANPDEYDLTGQDVHMTQSVTPRVGLPKPSDLRGDPGTDPIHGREWNTSGNDLQYACTFSIPPRTCEVDDPSCDCAGDTLPPVCGPAKGSQVKAKAYPSIRPLRVVKALGDRGVVGSICPTPLVGYNSTMSRIADRIEAKLAK